MTTLSPVDLTSPGRLAHGVCNPPTGLLSQPLAQTVGGAITTTDGLYDASVTRLSADGQAVLNSTYLGAGATTNGYGIAADAKSDAYVTGRTENAGFPVGGTVGGSLDNRLLSYTRGAPTRSAARTRRATKRRARTPSRSSSTRPRAGWSRWDCYRRRPPRPERSTARAAAAARSGWSSRAWERSSRCP